MTSAKGGGGGFLKYWFLLTGGRVGVQKVPKYTDVILEQPLGLGLGLGGRTGVRVGVGVTAGVGVQAGVFWTEVGIWTIEVRIWAEIWVWTFVRKALSKEVGVNTEVERGKFTCGSPQKNLCRTSGTWSGQIRFNKKSNV